MNVIGLYRRAKKNSRAPGLAVARELRPGRHPADLWGLTLRLLAAMGPRLTARSHNPAARDLALPGAPTVALSSWHSIDEEARPMAAPRSHGPGPVRSLHQRSNGRVTPPARVHGRGRGMRSRGCPDSMRYGGGRRKARCVRPTRTAQLDGTAHRIDI